VRSAILALCVAACVPTRAGNGFGGATACPPGASPDASGRCACAGDDVLALGACVDPGVGDAYCGPAARLTSGGCVFRTCEPDEALDVDGRCLPMRDLVRTRSRCEASGALLVESGQAVCVPADAACPRGTRFVGASCVQIDPCPAGALALEASRRLSLPDDGRPSTHPACEPVVTRTSGRTRVVDLGAWAVRALGPTEGRGSPELCGPLAARPIALGLRPGESLSIVLSIRLLVPDQDLSRAYAEVSAEDSRGEALPPEGDAIASRAVRDLTELLRGLGGDGVSASAAALVTRVECAVASL
jgi:hypothetical protein